jgi:hypothetical protein
MEPKLQFVDYPNDQQIIDLRYGSYAYNQDYLKLVFVDPALSYNTNYDNSFTFRNNPIWQDNNVTSTSSTYLSGSRFLNVIYRIRIQRKGKGVVVRLILPITLLCILGGLTFWAEYGSRVDSTITLLLAVSALYIVILGNIPLLGYLTDLDKYVLYVS